MKRYFCLACGLVSMASALAADTGAKLSAAQVVDKNVAARGGLAAWRAVKTLTLSGQLDAGGKRETDLPFVMRMKRPNRSRLEIAFEGQTAVQVFDGARGWKLRPFLGRNEVEPYTALEAKSARSWQDLDGPLVDHAKKGTKVVLAGMDTVEGHKAYKLKLSFKDGEQRTLWIDAANFLELKIDGDPRKLDGRLHKVAIYYRDYRAEKGLMMPHVLETVVEGGGKSHKLHIREVAANQPMEEGLFAKPSLSAAMATLTTGR